MSAPTVAIPDSLYARLKQMAEQQQISVDQFVASAVAEKLSAVEKEGYIAQRAKRADEKAFRDALSKIPNVEPEERDRL
jgi:hypothetical protein